MINRIKAGRWWKAIRAFFWHLKLALIIWSDQSGGNTNSWKYSWRTAHMQHWVDYRLQGWDVHVAINIHMGLYD